MSIYTTDLQTLYVAYFNRPADPAGLAFWEAALASGRATLNDVRAAFAKDTEYKAAFAGKTPTQIITQVYLNLFGDEPDMRGLEFWVQKMAEGAVTIDTVVAEIAKGAQNEDRIAIQSKAAAAVAFTEALDTVAERNAYDNAGAQAIAKLYISGVRDAATLQAATTTANLNKVTGDVVVAGNPGAAAVAAAKASYDTAAAAAATALTDATTKAAAATTAAAAVTAAQTAATAAQTKADATDAAALTAAAATAKATADAAAAAKVTADANVVTAQAAFQAAVQAGDPAAVTVANGNLLIAQARATNAATAVTEANAKLATANAAAAAAVADDAAAATAAAAITTAVTAATGAAAAAVAAGTAATTAAAAAATAANAYVTAANGTAENADNVAAAAAVSAAATASTNAAAAAASANAANAVVQAVLTEAQGQAEVAAAVSAYNAAVTASATAAAATAAAATAADAAIAGADSLEKANAAIAAANAQATAAAAQKTAADAIAAAAAAYAAAAAKTASGADNTAATAAVAAAAAATAAANAAVAAAQEDVTKAAALPGNFVAKVITLTGGVDVEPGGAGADTFNAILDTGAGAAPTLTALDIINGGAGVDTLNIVDLDGGQAIPGSAQIRNVEVINIRSAGATSLNTTNNSVDIVGATNINVTQATDVTLTTGATTALNVSGTRGFVTLNGGASQTVDAVTQSGKIDLAGSAGAVTVTSAAQGTQAIEIDGGSTVNVTATATGTAAAAAAEVANVTVAGSTDNAGDVVSITVGGQVFNATGIFADGAAVATALAAAIDADAAYTATAVGGKLTITAEVPGTPFTVGTASVTTNVGAASTVTSSSLTGTINVGQTTSATGAVVVNANIQSDGTGAHVTGGAINVKGGSSITVNANLASAAKDNDSDFDGAIGTITAVGDGKTTSVSLNQVKSATTVTKAAVATVKETSVVTFGAMKSGEELTINGLTFTASKDLTAEQVAAAFSNLSVDDTQSENGPVANGYYSGSFLTAGSEWTSGAASGKTVTFTAKDENETNLTFGGDATTNDGGARIPTQVVTAGTLGTASDRSGNVTTYGAVRVDDAATAAITTVSVNGYLSADLGLTGSDLNALTTLSLANSAGAATVRSDETTLGLTVNNVRHGVDLGASYTTLNVTASGANSTFGLTAGGVKDLTVAGDKTVTVTGAAAMGALETVTVTGSAGLSLGANSVAKSVTTTGTTGTVTATLAATATYTGGAGVDNVSLLATSITKDVVLGAGNDTLNLVAGTTASSVVLDGGAGTDTLAMASADAATLSAAAVFETKFTGFERLQLNLATDGARTVDMSNLNDINYVIAAGGAGVSDLTLNKFVNGGTLELTGGATTTTVSLADATGTADVLNIVTKVVSTDVNFNTVAAAGVETINITATDTTLDDNGDGANDPVETATLTLSDAALKSLVIGGNANVDLSLNANVVALNSVDARGLTGSLTIATNNVAGTVAATILGGSGSDSLTATGTAAHQLNGGAGDDVLTANAGLSILTGGAGSDTFVIGVASTNVNSASTIADLSSGDVISFTGATSFSSAAVALDATTAVFQDYANAAIASVGANGLAWFVFQGNTYIVMDAATGAGDGTTFENGHDMIVKITGVKDLSTGSFNTDGLFEMV